MSVATTIGIPAAFVAGLLSFLSPCVLPLVPAYLSYISGTSVEELQSASGANAIRRTGLKSLIFVLGFSVVFVAMGATATSIGQYMNARLDLLMKAAGLTIVLFGMHMLGAIRIRALYSERRLHFKFKSIGFVGAFLVGIVFALGWTPCIGPILMSILTLAANSHTVYRGMVLLGAYSLGLGIPFLLAGFATSTMLNATARIKRHFRKVEVASGILMISVGILVFTGNLDRITTILQHAMS